MTFEQWLKKVDGVLASYCGLGHRDLADQTWWDWWEADYTPEEAAQETLENEGFPVDSWESE